MRKEGKRTIKKIVMKHDQDQKKKKTRHCLINLKHKGCILYQNLMEC